MQQNHFGNRYIIYNNIYLYKNNKHYTIMSFRRISLVSIIVLLTIVFSSCHEDDYFTWRPGALQRAELFYTDRYGEINKFFIIDERDIQVDESRFVSIEDFRKRGPGEIFISIKNRDILHNLILHIDGTNVDLEFRDLVNDNLFTGKTDRELDRFMGIVVEELHARGSVRINVKGKNRFEYNKIPVEIELFTELDVEVRR